MTVQLRQNAETIVATCPTTMVEIETPAKGGIAKGSVILTAKGEVAVEDLKAGDRIITRERGMSVLKSVTCHSVPACTVRAGSLGANRPERDITVAASQHIAIRDWRAEALFDMKAAQVPASRLADGTHIALFGEAQVFRLDFGTPLTIYANGLETPVGRTESGIVTIPADN